jgi:predicted GNAT family N-acyltransferase
VPWQGFFLLFIPKTKKLTPSMKKLLQTQQFQGRSIDIFLFQDTDPELNPIFSLWYEVYIHELQYVLPADHTAGLLAYEPNGSMIIAAFEQGLCVGSLRISGNDHCPLEFPYEHYVNDRPIIEISKLIIAGSYRKTPLKNWIIQEAKQWIIEHYAPSYICLNSSEKLTLFYTLMNFKKLSETPVIHPEIGNKSYLMATKSETFQLLPMARTTPVATPKA